MNIVKFKDIKLIHRNPLNFYTLTMRKWKEKLRKQFHSPLWKKRIKYLGIYLPKETKDLYKKKLKKKTDERNQRWHK